MNIVHWFQKLPRFLRRHKLLRLLARLIGPIQPVRVNQAFDAYIDLRDGFARLIAIEDEFETEFFELARFLLPDKQPTFVDVGANFGLMTIGLWHQTKGQITARLYEPNSHLCAIIERSLQKNEFTGTTLVHGAAMETEGEVYLKFDLHHTGAGYVGRESTGIAVPALRLDVDLADAKMDSVDLIKIDVEGNEGAVLAGLSSYLSEHRVRALYFEYCPDHIRRSACTLDPITVLQSHGYEVFLRDPAAIKEAGGVTHQLHRRGKTLPLTLITSAPNLKITDLLALPAGTASSQLET